MKTIWRFALLLYLCAVSAVRTWWVFIGERGVEADDPDKEREEVR